MSEVYENGNKSTYSVYIRRANNLFGNNPYCFSIQCTGYIFNGNKGASLNSNYQQAIHVAEVKAREFSVEDTEVKKYTKTD